MAAEQLRITTLKGLVPFLKKEVEELGFVVDSETQNSISIQGAFSDAVWLNLNLRTAFHILYPLISFHCRHPDDLYEAAISVPWEEWLMLNSTISVTSTVNHPSITDTRFPNLKIKDAIADRMRQKTGQRPNSGPDATGAVIRLYWKDEEASLFIDTSGEPLSRRGYRVNPYVAPLQEPLAAAIIMATNWKIDMPFVNPMCGSGTIGIEAALMAIRRAPGLIRKNYGFMHIKKYSAAYYKECIEELLENQLSPTEELPIRLSDWDEGALEASKRNAHEAGLDNLLQYEYCDFADTSLFEAPFCVLLNPEYGIRLGNEEELKGTYRRIGDFFKKRCPGSTGYVFSGNMELLKGVGLAPKRRIPFFSAKIECRLYEFDIYASSRPSP
jgi:putative N6-adenine-specific DNA methylase